jgi:cell division transport system permease protein
MSAYVSQHFAAFKSALRRLATSPLNTLLSLVVIGAALALPAAGWVVLDNLQHLAGNTSRTQQISVFMATDASRKDVAEVESRLRDIAAGEWRFVSREDALKRMQATEGMAEIVAGLHKNPLPDAFFVEPADPQPETLERLAAIFKSWPKVAHVQLDSAWSKRFDAFLRIGKLAVTLLAGLFAGALIAVTFNTIRLQILAQAAEIEVARLVGATDAFIRRPFHYFGALQGALGGLFAVALIATCGILLSGPVAELLALYSAGFTPRGLSLPHAGIVIGTGAALGWLGAQISVTLHLRHV